MPGRKIDAFKSVKNFFFEFVQIKLELNAFQKH